MTRTDSRRREAGRLFILSVTDNLDHVSILETVAWRVTPKSLLKNSSF